MQRRTLKERLDASYKDMVDAQKKHDDLLAQYTEREEKALTRRSIERGKMAEHALPELAALTKAQFITYIEKVMQTDEARLILMELCEEPETPAEPMGEEPTGQDGGTTAPKPEEAAAQTNTLPAPKPAETPHNGGTGGNNNGGNPNRHNNQQHAQKPNNPPQNGNGSGNDNGGGNTGQ